jgi:hypothetical protein
MSTKKERDEKLIQVKLQQIERLRYQAQLAERQFNQVDPSNRLVASELEKRWESALIDLKQAEGQVEKENQTATVPLLISQKIKNSFENIGKKMPEVWQQNILSREQKKGLLRSLIDKIVIHRMKMDTVSTRIVWKGGDTTTTNIPVHTNSFTDLTTAKEIEQIIIKLANSGKTDKEIAIHLSDNGYRGIRRDHILPSMVQKIRLSNGIHSNRKKLRHVPGQLTVSQIAKAIGVTPSSIHNLIYKGIIHIKRNKSKLYLFPENPQTVEQFKNLMNGKVKKLHF